MKHRSFNEAASKWTGLFFCQGNKQRSYIKTKPFFCGNISCGDLYICRSYLYGSIFHRTTHDIQNLITLIVFLS